MSENSPVSIDQDKCIQCMECVRTCPTAVLYEKDGIVTVTKAADAWCSRCAHCVGVCPEDAISINIYKDEFEKVPIPDIKIDPEEFLNFLRARRSTRLFKPDPINKSDLEQLINAARYAPSAHNDQSSEFTVIIGERVDALRNLIVDEYSKFFNALPEDPDAAVKVLEQVVPKSMANTDTIEMMRNLLNELEKGKKDRLFWRAPAIIIITAHKKFNISSMVIENSSLTAAYLMLMAEAMNLGTCSLGLLIGAIANSRKVAKMAGIPKGHKARYALAIGKKDTNFKYLLPRNKPKINFLE